MKRLLTTFLALTLLLAMSASAFAQLRIIGDIETGLTENNELYVRFNTGDPSMASVEYGVGGEFAQTPQRTSLTGQHNIVISGLAPATTYTLRVHVSNWSGDSFVSDDFTYTTPALVSPSDVRASTRDSQARISWSPVFGGAQYIVERADAANGPFQVLDTVSTTLYVDNNVENEKQYFYRVTAVDAAGNKAAPSEVIAVVIEPAIVDTDFSDLDLDFWTFHEHNPTAVVEVSNGRLVLYNFTPESQVSDVRTAGIVNRDPIDMTGVKTIIEVGYSEVNLQELNVGFSDKLVGKDDPWWHNGFRVTGNPGGMNLTKFNGDRNRNDADVTFSPGWSSSVTYPLDLRIEFEHTGGKNFNIKLFINGQQRHSGTMSFGSLNPETMHVYLYASTGVDGFGAFDYVRIWQE